MRDFQFVKDNNYFKVDKDNLDEKKVYNFSSSLHGVIDESKVVEYWGKSKGMAVIPVYVYNGKGNFPEIDIKNQVFHMSPEKKHWFELSSFLVISANLLNYLGVTEFRFDKYESYRSEIISGIFNGMYDEFLDEVELFSDFDYHYKIIDKYSKEFDELYELSHIKDVLDVVYNVSYEVLKDSEQLDLNFKLNNIHLFDIPMDKVKCIERDFDVFEDILLNKEEKDIMNFYQQKFGNRYGLIEVYIQRFLFEISKQGKDIGEYSKKLFNGMVMYSLNRFNN